MRYIKITPEFAAQYTGYIQSPHIFMPLQTNKGEWVCDSLCLEHFPHLFKGNNNIEELDLVTKDFQPDYSKLDIVVAEKYSLKMRIEDYYERTITLIYIANGEEVKKIIAMEDTKPTKDGYSVNLDDIVTKEEAAKDIVMEEFIKNRKSDAQVPNGFLK